MYYDDYDHGGHSNDTVSRDLREGDTTPTSMTESSLLDELIPNDDDLPPGQHLRAFVSNADSVDRLIPNVIDPILPRTPLHESPHFERQRLHRDPKIKKVLFPEASVVKDVDIESSSSSSIISSSLSPPVSLLDKKAEHRFAMLRVALPLCMFGFFRTWQPSQPFLAPYLVQDKGFTLEQVNNILYPVWTYAYLAGLAVIGLATDCLGYKRMIFVEVIMQVITRGMLIWGRSMTCQLIAEATLGLANAAETCYQSYAYNLVAPEYYQKLSSYTSVALFLGYTLSSLAGQLLYDYAHVPLVALFYISLGSILIAGLIAFFFLPSTREFKKLAEQREFIRQAMEAKVQNTKQFAFLSFSPQRKTAATSSSMTQSPSPPSSITTTEAAANSSSDKMSATLDGASSSAISFDANRGKLDVPVFFTATHHPIASKHHVVPRKRRVYHRSYWRTLFLDIKLSYWSSSMLWWSFWSIVGAAGLVSAENYGSSLWLDISPGRIFNGYVEAAASLGAALGALLPTSIEGLLGNTSLTLGEWICSLGAVSAGILNYYQAQVVNLLGSYALYVTFECVMYGFTAIANCKIAERTEGSRYAMVFGLNTFLSTFIATLLQIILSDGLDVSIKERFVANAGFMIAFGGLAFTSHIYLLSRRTLKKASRHREGHQLVEKVEYDIKLDIYGEMKNSREASIAKGDEWEEQTVAASSDNLKWHPLDAI